MPGSRRSTVACSTHDSVSIRWRAPLSEKASIESPLCTPIAVSSKPSGVLLRPSMTICCTRMLAANATVSRSRATVPPGWAERASRMPTITTVNPATPP